MNDDWTKDIQRLMADREAKAPDGLLDDIKAEMARRGLSVAAPKRARTVPLWRYRWVAAAAVALLIALPIVWKTRPNEPVAAVGEKGGVSAPNPQKTPIPSMPQPVLATSHDDYAAKPLPLRRNGLMIAAQTEGDETVTATPLQRNEEPVAAQPSDVVSAKAGGKPAGNDKKKPSRRYDEPLTQYDEAGWHRKGDPKLSLTAYYGGSANGSGGGLSMAAVMADAPSQDNPAADLVEPATNFLYRESQDRRKAHHKQPVKVGVSVGYRLNDRWALQTGVTYSFLSTDFDGQGSSTQTQKLHYVGVPLTASFSVVRGRKAEVYVTAGGEVEKLVKGTMKSAYFEDATVKESRPQFSVKAAVGGAYSFAPGVSVYVEPGVTHYFDNHSAVVNVYKDRPTGFSLNLGFRININK